MQVSQSYLELALGEHEREQQEKYKTLDYIRMI